MLYKMTLQTNDLLKTEALEYEIINDAHVFGKSDRFGLC